MKLKTWRLIGSTPILKQLTTAELYFKKCSRAIQRSHKIIPFVCLLLLKKKKKRDKGSLSKEESCVSERSEAAEDTVTGY